MVALNIRRLMVLIGFSLMLPLPTFATICIPSIKGLLGQMVANVYIIVPLGFIALTLIMNQRILKAFSIVRLVCIFFLSFLLGLFSFILYLFLYSGASYILYPTKPYITFLVALLIFFGLLYLLIIRTKLMVFFLLKDDLVRKMFIKYSVGVLTFIITVLATYEVGAYVNRSYFTKKYIPTPGTIIVTEDTIPSYCTVGFFESSLFKQRK